MIARLPKTLAGSALAVGVLLTVAIPGGGARAQDSEGAINRSFIAFTIPEKDLLPENVAYDPVEEAFYVGSTRKGKIVKIDRRGVITDFVDRGRAGLWMVIGMKADAERRHLWVCSSGGGNLVGWSGDRGRAAGVFKFDLDSGRLIDRWSLEEPGAVHFFNDLAVAPTGDVYATHMFDEPAVYVIRSDAGELELLASDPDLTYPNGITLGDAGELFVAHREGISVVDPATGASQLLDAPEGAGTTGVDGLYHHEGDLIAIRPGAGEVRRLRLGADRRAIVVSEVLEARHPMFNDPTTGVVVGDTLYYVANSQFGLVEDGELPAAEELYEVVVLKLPLKGD